MLAQKNVVAKPCVKAAKPVARPVKPVAMQKKQQAAAKVASAGIVGIASAAIAAAPVEAANIVANVASATEGYPFVPPAWAPSLFVPLTGLVLPAIGMAWAFTYIQKEKQ
uniref:Photosystem I reaction center subunit VIII n=3 Tax=Dunaliella tertiolecta TaxID=3047 RepID=A0AC62AEM2_DUNTE|mmetsp:Transcript_19753/g.51291  ORF Transcript_19753/g.51291 Transcript_19753/m.51291 type:complete len:110 (+) Transcript_19753:200-529(+)